MKKILIIIFAVLLILAGCSAEKSEVPAANEEVDTAIEENNNEINEEEIKGPDEEEADQPEEPVESEGGNVIPHEETNESEQEEKPAQADLPKNEPVTEEPAAEEPEEEDLPADDNLEIQKNVLKIRGLAENELSLSLDELKKMNDIIFEADFYSLNNFGTTGYTHFKGVKLWDLLEGKALIKPEASKITITAQDGYSMEFAIDQVKMEYMDETNPDNKYPMIIAWEENGQEYSPDEGAPYKLVVGQKEPGDINKPQWVSNIDIINIE
ncbi:MAG TPA: molybdopterin-dependent oxidoreductase [Sedimentibacter sp.]|nr:molybdopterin-dependent oxidoreductase [Sedimentibacter sp.]